MYLFTKLLNSLCLISNPVPEKISSHEPAILRQILKKKKQNKTKRMVNMLLFNVK